MAHEVVVRINQLMDRERTQARAMLTAMQFPAQDVLLTDEHDSIGKVLCGKGTIAHISFLQPTTRSILQWLSTCGIVQLQAPARNTEKNYAHLADLFHQLNAFEAEEQKICYEALSAIPALHPSPLLWALKAGDSRLLETLVRIAGEAVYQPIEEKTLLQHTLSSHNQEMFDGLNRVIENKEYLAAELHQLFEPPAAAARNRKILMFSEVSWLKESKYKELRLKIIKLQQSMRARYIQRQRAPQEINRVLIAALMENDQDQVDLLLAEIQERNITFDATQMTTTVLDQLGHERSQRVLAFMQQRNISLNVQTLHNRIQINLSNMDQFQALIQFAKSLNLTIDLSTPCTTAIINLLAQERWSATNIREPGMLQAFMACMDYIQSIRDTVDGDSRWTAAQRLMTFAHNHQIYLNAGIFTQAIVNCLIQPGNPNIVTAQKMVVFARQNNIALKGSVFVDQINYCFNRTRISPVSYSNILAPDLYTSQSLIDFSRSNQIEITIDESVINEKISTCLNKTKKVNYSNIPDPDCQTAQQLIEFSQKNRIKTYLSKVTIEEKIHQSLQVGTSYNDSYGHVISNHPDIQAAQLLIEFSRINSINIDFYRSAKLVVDACMERTRIKKHKNGYTEYMADPDFDKMSEFIIFRHEGQMTHLFIEGLLTRKKENYTSPDIKRLKFIKETIRRTGITLEINQKLIDLFTTAINQCRSSRKAAELRKIAIDLHIPIAGQITRTDRRYRTWQSIFRARDPHAAQEATAEVSQAQTEALSDSSSDTEYEDALDQLPQQVTSAHDVVDRASEA